MSAMAGGIAMSIMDDLKTLHTSAVDARNGYREALKEAEGKGMSPLFAEMIDVHDGHASQLAGMLAKAGEQAGSGSFMSTVHETIMDVRGLFSGLDESVLPGLIDGEHRNIGKYDDAINGGLPGPERSAFEQQRAELQAKVAKMESMRA
jgi:uncharacterized protein (TIGR02284 family)